MRKRLSFIVPAAVALWWVIRLGTVQQGLSFEAGITVGVLTHFALLLLVCSITAFQLVSPPSFIDSFKHVLRPAVLYALLAALSTVGFHHVAQSEATALRQLERERFIEQSLNDEAAYAALQESDPRLSSIDRDTARERAMDSLRFQFNPLWHFTASLLLWIAAAMSTALFTSLLGQWLRAWPS